MVVRMQAPRKVIGRADIERVISTFDDVGVEHASRKLKIQTIRRRCVG